MKKNTKPALVEERFFPFECSTSYGIEDEYTMLHWHREMEICYIKQGKGKYLINGIEYSFSEGDIFVISNDEIHVCHDDENLVMQVIMFDPNFLQSGYANPFDYEYLHPFLESSDLFCNKLDGKNPITTQLSLLLAEIEAEYTAMNKGYDLMIKALLLRFLTLIIRHCFSDDSFVTKKSISRCAADKIRNIITFLDNHYSEKISLKMLSQRFDISIPYLCSTFKAFTDSSPIDFLIKRRILAAKFLLSSTDKSVIETAEECGFGSLSNFNHLFKALTGYSPNEYRNSHL